MTECQKWRPIEEAPKNGTVVDLWIIWPDWITKNLRGRRAVNCRYSNWGDSWVDDRGTWVTGRSFNDEDGRGFDPSDKSENAIVATHFMPLPEPPEESK